MYEGELNQDAPGSYRGLAGVRKQKVKRKKQDVWASTSDSTTVITLWKQGALLHTPKFRETKASLMIESLNLLRKGGQNLRFGGSNT